MTNSEILRELQAITKRHALKEPKIAIDSLLLSLKLKKAEMLPFLIELDMSGFITLDDNSVTITEVGMEAIT